MPRTCTFLGTLLLLSALTGACVEGGGDNLSGPTTVEAGLSGPTWLPVADDLSAPPDGHLAFRVMVNHHGSEHGVEITRVWEQLAEPALFGGAEATIRIERDRFPTCGLSGEVWAALAFDTGETLDVPLTDGDPQYGREGRFTVPLGVATAEVWLWTDDGHGCVEYDSDFGHNYRFTVHDWSPTVVSFGAHGPASASQAIVAGGALVVDYAPDRLQTCRTVYRGFPTWNLVTHVSFDGGPALSQETIRFAYGDYGVPNGEWAPMRAVFPVPHDAAIAEVWFENTVSYPPVCHDWDSNGGANYPFSVAEPGTVAVDGPVTLARKAYTTRSHPSLYTMTHVLSGEVLVDNLAYDKLVTIHYVGSDGAWRDAAASYTGPSLDHEGYEIWSFEIAEPVYKVPPDGFFRFAIRYEVAGATYWDNNGGEDYEGAAGF